MRTWPGPGSGSAVSRTCRAPGPPALVIQTARIVTPSPSWLALTRSLRRSLPRARRSEADVHLLLLVACSDDDRHAGRVVDPVSAHVGQPSAAAWVGAVADDDPVAGRAPPDAEPAGEGGGDHELERGARPDDQAGLRE